MVFLRQGRLSKKIPPEKASTNFENLKVLLAHRKFDSPMNKCANYLRTARRKNRNKNTDPYRMEYEHKANVFRMDLYSKMLFPHVRGYVKPLASLYLSYSS